MKAHVEYFERATGIEVEAYHKAIKMFIKDHKEKGFTEKYEILDTLDSFIRIVIHQLRKQKIRVTQFCQEALWQEAICTIIRHEDIQED